MGATFGGGRVAERKIMRTLIRNQQTIWFAKYLGTEPQVDSNGWETGEPLIKYSNPIKIEKTSPKGICVSQNKGDTEDTLFGKNTDYDRVMTTCDMDCEIDEYSILWIDVDPVIKEDGSTDVPHDYIVSKGVPPIGKRSGNSLTYAIKKV